MTAFEVEVLTLKAIVGDARVSPEDAVARIDSAGVVVTDFSDSKTQALFSAIVAELREGRPPEIVSLIGVVKSRVPRDLAINVLTDYDTRSASQRLAALREASQRRQTIAVLRGMASLFESEVGFNEAMSELRTAIGGLSEVGSLRTAEGTTLELSQRLHDAHLGRRVPVIPTGIAALDCVIGGLQPTLTIVGALPAVGKSALVATLVGNLATRGLKVGLLSLEDEARWLTTRLTSKVSGVSVPALSFTPLDADQLERADEALQQLHQPLTRVVVEDRHGLSTAEVVATARRMVAVGCKAIFLDHLGEVRLQRTDRHDLDIADALSQLRGIAKTYGVPVLVLCHLRRRDGLDAKSEPKLTDFAFSAAVERMSRVALGLWRQGDQLAVSVLKQTSGPANICVRLNMHLSSGTVAPTDPSPELKADMRELWGAP